MDFEAFRLELGADLRIEVADLLQQFELRRVDADEFHAGARPVCSPGNATLPRETQSVISREGPEKDPARPEWSAKVPEGPEKDPARPRDPNG